MALAQSLIIFPTLLAAMQLGLLLLQVLLILTSLFLMMLILVQRGKGGGLTGALGGMGGQSAFGSKAGDAFTKITVIASVVWILLCMLTIARFNPPPAAKTADQKTSTGISAPADADGETKTGDSASSGIGTKTGEDATSPTDGAGETSSADPTTESEDGAIVEGLSGSADSEEGVELDLGGAGSTEDSKGN